MILVLFFLMAFGLLMLNSASMAVAHHRYGEGSFFLQAQAVRLMCGLVLMFGISKIDYHKYHRLAKPFLIFTIILLVILVLPFTTAVAPVIKNVRRWIIFPVTFQPSELVKLALVIWCATTIISKGQRIRDFRDGILPIVCILAFIMFLIVLEPDLSTSVLCFSIVAVILFLGRAKIHHILALIPIFCAAILLIAWIKGYQLDRIIALIKALIDPSQGILEENYHRHQSLIALGSGGWIGKGIGNGMQKYFFLPEPHTDYIFSVMGEELGFLTTTGVIILFFLLGYCGYEVMTKCHDLFGFILVGGILTMIFIPMLFSVAINLGMLPAAGVGLPFISYGGSSLVTHLAGFGIILNVAEHNRTGVKGSRKRK
jgi:cell division protein FtsW